MTPLDTADVLTAIASYDLRTVGESDVIAWHAAIGELPKALALEAVVIHHKTSTERIKPAHVIGIAKGIRRDRAERENADNVIRGAFEDGRDKQLGLTAGNPAFGGLPIAAEGQPVWAAYYEGSGGRRALDHPCPRCDSQPSEACVNPVNGRAQRIPCLVRLTGRTAGLGGLR